MILIDRTVVGELCPLPTIIDDCAIGVVQGLETDQSTVSGEQVAIPEVLGGIGVAIEEGDLPVVDYADEYRAATGLCTPYIQFDRAAGLDGNVIEECRIGDAI